MAMEYEWAGDVKQGGLYLRRLREAHGWTQRDLEKRTGGLLSGGYISALETGIVVKPPLASVVLLGKALGVSPNEVARAYGVWEEPETHNEPDEIIFLKRVLAQQTVGQRHSLLQSVRALASVAERGL
jgi:transcriptional regulator with XRE-family HTH domain